MPILDLIEESDVIEVPIIDDEEFYDADGHGEFEENILNENVNDDQNVNHDLDENVNERRYPIRNRIPKKFHDYVT